MAPCCAFSHPITEEETGSESGPDSSSKERPLVTGGTGLVSQCSRWQPQSCSRECQVQLQSRAPDSSFSIGQTLGGAVMAQALGSKRPQGRPGLGCWLRAPASPALDVMGVGNERSQCGHFGSELTNGSISLSASPALASYPQLWSGRGQQVSCCVDLKSKAQLVLGAQHGVDPDSRTSCCPGSEEEYILSGPSTPSFPTLFSAPASVLL